MTKIFEMSKIIKYAQNYLIFTKYLLQSAKKRQEYHYIKNWLLNVFEALLKMEYVSTINKNAILYWLIACNISTIMVVIILKVMNFNFLYSDDSNILFVFVI